MLQLQPGQPSRDPARPASTMRRGVTASVDDLANAIHQHRRAASPNRWSGTPMEPPDPARKLPVPNDPSRSRSQSRHPRHRREIEIPITQRLRPAGSFFGDFRTPVGARNSSRNRNGGFGGSHRRKLPSLSFEQPIHSARFAFSDPAGMRQEPTLPDCRKADFETPGPITLVLTTAPSPRAPAGYRRSRGRSGGRPAHDEPRQARGLRWQ